MKSKRIFYLFLALALGIFDQVFNIINYDYLDNFFRKFSSDVNFTAMMGSLIEFIVFALVFYFVFKDNPLLNKIDKNYNRKSLKWYEIILISLGLAGLTGIWFFVVDKFLVQIPYVKNSLDTFNKAMDLGTNSGANYVISIIYGAVLAALMEELLFRGIFHNSIKILTKNRKAAIILTGLLFGVWHGILVQGIYAAIGGVIFSYIYERTGKLSVTIAIHFLNNFLSTVVEDLNNLMPGIYDAFDILCFIMVPILIYYLYKIRPEDNFKEISE